MFGWIKQLKILTKFVIPCVLVFTIAGCSGGNSGGNNIRPEAITPNFQSNLTVMTFNIRHGCGREKWGNTSSGFFKGCAKKYDEIIAAIKSADPDVVGLQEVNSGQAERIGKAINMNYVYYRHNSWGYGGSWGNAILSKFKILESGYVAIGGSAGRNRSMVSATVLVNDRPIAFMSVHTDHRTSDNDSRSFKRILQHIDTLSIPIVLVGDFNTGPLNPNLSLIKEGAGFIDSAFESEKQGRKLGTWASPRDHRLDYVFVQSRYFNVLEAALVAEQHHRASDHIAYYTVIEWK